MNIVLHEPGIALNTGNIGRSCAATDSSLHLIRPYGFRISEKDIKRAGMDYWEKIDLYEYIDYEDFLEKHPEKEKRQRLSKRIIMASGVLCRTAGTVRLQNIMTGRTAMHQSFGLPQPRQSMHIPRYATDRTITLCSATNPQAYRRRYL